MRLAVDETELREQTAPGERLCVCGHPERLHWLRGEVVVTGEVSCEHATIKELVGLYRAECALSSCLIECQQYEPAA